MHVFDDPLLIIYLELYQFTMLAAVALASLFHCVISSLPSLFSAEYGETFLFVDAASLLRGCDNIN